MAKSYLEYLQEILQSQETEKNNQLMGIDEKYSAISKETKDKYSSDIKTVNETYDDYIDQSYVQKIIDQKQVEQTLANMGLTDSGLNRTQQTAAILSHSNRTGKYNSLRQQQIDSLAREMQGKLTDLRLEQEKEKTTVTDKLKKSAEDQAMDIYKSELAAEAKIQAERIKAASKSSGTTNKKTDPTETKEETKEEYTGTLTQDRRNILEKMCEEGLITRQRFNNERRLGNVSGTYEDYIKSTLLKWRIDLSINQEEYEYLLQYFGFEIK